MKGNRWDSVNIQILHAATLKVGDEIVITDKQAKVFFKHPHMEGVFESNEYGGCFGLIGTIVGYAPDVVDRYRASDCYKAPGFYTDHIFPQIEFSRLMDKPFADPENKIYIYAEDLMMTDQKEYRSRMDTLFAGYSNKAFGESTIPKNSFLCNLPDTKFWEGDFVHVRDDIDMGKRTLPKPDEFGRGTAMVGGLNFSLHKTHDKKFEKYCSLQLPTQTPRYFLSDRFNISGNQYWFENELELVTRGHFWKQAHGETQIFPDLAEEMYFNMKARNAKCIKTIYNSKYADVIDFIRNNTDAHALYYKNEFIDWGSTDEYHIYKFYNADLARRAREATLNGQAIPSYDWLKWHKK